MRRYYMIKLNNIQIMIKIILLNLIIWGIYLVIINIIDINIEYIYKYILIPLILLSTIFIYTLFNNKQTRSFYFLNDNIILCKNRKEKSVYLYSIDQIELLTDIDIIFGIKKIILSSNKANKKYVIILNKIQAKILIKWLENKINKEGPLIDDLYEFFKN